MLMLLLLVVAMVFFSVQHARRMCNETCYAIHQVQRIYDAELKIEWMDKPMADNFYTHAHSIHTRKGQASDEFREIEPKKIANLKQPTILVQQFIERWKFSAGMRGGGECEKNANERLTLIDH